MAAESLKTQWQTVWPGGQSITEYIKANPDIVAGKHVLDHGAGGGIASVQAIESGARLVEAFDLVQEAVDHINEKKIEGLKAYCESPVFKSTNADVILVGSVPVPPGLLKWLIELRYQNKLVLISGGEETILPVNHLTKLAKNIWTIKYPAHRLLLPTG